MQTIMVSQLREIDRPMWRALAHTHTHSRKKVRETKIFLFNALSLSNYLFVTT